jgi:hypothetical protein
MLVFLDKINADYRSRINQILLYKKKKKMGWYPANYTLTPPGLSTRLGVATRIAGW